MQSHLLNFVSNLSSREKAGQLCAKDWQDVFVDLGARRTSEMIVAKSRFPWKKKISIPTTKTFAAMFKIGLKLCRGLASGDLPFAILPKENIPEFHAALKRNYGTLADKFAPILNHNTDMVICCYAGFKPHGDDA